MSDQFIAEKTSFPLSESITGCIKRKSVLQPRSSALNFLSALAFALMFIGSVHAADIGYVYNEIGRLISVTNFDGGNAEYHYDAVGNITSVKKNISSTLSISEFTPNGGAQGDIVQIFGSGFNATSTSNVVTFNGTTAVVMHASTSSLSVLVPAGATTGRIAVVNSNGSVTSSVDFKMSAITKAPTITGFSPAVGGVGTSVTVTGTNFQSALTSNKVYFGSSLARTSSATSINVTAPVPITSAGKISVITPYGQATSTADFYAVPDGINVAEVEYTGRLLVDGPVKSVALSASGKEALLLFDASQFQYLSLMSSGGTFSDMTITIYDPQGQRVFSSPLGISDAVNFARFAQGGTYSILLSPSSAGKVDLQLKSDVTDVIAIDGAPLTVSVGAGHNGHYIFSGVGGQSLGLGFTNMTTVPTTGTYFRIYKPNGTELYTAYSDPIASPNGGFTLPVLPVSGQYTLLLDPSGLAVASATLTLSSEVHGTLVPNAAATTISIPRAGQTARFDFSGIAGERYSFSFAKGTFPSTVPVTIYKTDGSSVVTDNIGTSGSLDLPVLSTSGKYQMFMDPTGTAIGAVDVRLLREERGAITVDGSPLTINLGAEQNGRYTFVGSAGQRLGLGFTQMSSVPADYTFFQIYKPDGTLLVSTSSATDNSLNVPVLPVAGQYTLLVNPSGSSVVSATLTLSSDVTGTLEPDAATTTVNLVRAGQNARYRFIGTAGQRDSVSFTSGTFPSTVTATVLEEDGGSLVSASVGTSGSLDMPALPATGTYELFIDPANGGTGAINMRLLNEASGVLSIDGAPLAVNLSAGQNGRYYFTGVAGQMLGLGFTGMSAAPAGSTYFRIYKPDGTELISASSSANGGLNIPALPVAGQYTLLVDPPGNSALSVTLTLSSDVGGTLVVNAATTRVSITRAGQNARYRFSGTAGQRYSLGFANGTFPSNIALVVYKEDGSSLVSGSVSSAGTLVIPALPSTGTYQLLIDPVSAGIGSIDVSLVSEASGAITIDGAPLAVSLSAGQTGRYTFSGAAGQGLALAFTEMTASVADGITYFHIYKPDGTEFYKPGASGSNSSAVAIPVLPVSGQYTLVVEPPAGSVVSVNLTLISDLIATISPDAATITFSTARPGQNARYRFSGTAGQRYSAVFSNGTFPPVNTVTVYKEDGSKLVSGSIYKGGALDLPALPVTGNYQLFIDPNGLDNGAIDVRLVTGATGTLAIDSASLAVSLKADQKGYYTFNRVLGQSQGLGISGMTTTLASGTTRFDIFRPGGAMLTGTGVLGIANGELEIPDEVGAGEYLLRISPSANSEVTVNLTLTSDADAMLVPNAAATTFTATRPGQKALYRFSGTVGQIYSLNFTNSTFPSAAIKVIKPDGISYLARGSIAANGTISLPAIPTTGTYQVLINPSAGALGKVDVQLR